MSLIGLLLYLIIIAAVLGLLEYILRTMPPPAPWAVIIRVAVAVILIIVLLGMVTGGIHSPIVIR